MHYYIIHLPTEHKRILALAFEHWMHDIYEIDTYAAEYNLYTEIMHNFSDTIPLTSSQVDQVFSWLKKYMSPGFGAQRTYDESECELFFQLEAVCAEIKKNSEESMNKEYLISETDTDAHSGIMTWIKKRIAHPFV